MTLKVGEDAAKPRETKQRDDELGKPEGATRLSEFRLDDAEVLLDALKALENLVALACCH